MNGQKRIGMLLIIAVILFVASSGVVSAVAPGWSEPRIIDTITPFEEVPFIIQDSDGTYWLTWTAQNESSWFDVWITNSTDGIAWLTPWHVTEDSILDSSSSMISGSDKYWMAWSSDKSGNSDIWIVNSSDGMNWSTPAQVDTNTSSDEFSSLINDSNGTFWLTWDSPRSGSWDIWIANSTNGINWSIVGNIDTGTGDRHSSLIQDAQGKYWVTWDSNSEIFISNSTDGINWSTPLQITTDPAGDSTPSIMQDNNGLYWISWKSERSGDKDIWIMSSDNGYTWSSLTRITTNTSDDVLSRLLHDKNDTFWLVWDSNRIAPGHIWISHLAITLTSPIGNETLSGIYNITWNAADVDRLNNTFDIYYNTTNGTNWTLITSGLNNTTTSYLWNTTGVPDGTNYTIKVTRVNSYAGNATDISGNFSIDNPPQSVTGLTNTTGITWINWTWMDPSNPDFNHTMVYINGAWEANVSTPYYNDTELTAYTAYTIGTHTVDINGNTNTTWVNSSATTKGFPPNIISWSNNKTNDQTPSITINESELVKFNVTSNQSITTYSWYKDGVDQNWNYDNNTTSWAANGTYEVNISVYNLNGSTANISWSITVNDITAPVSITNIANVTGTTWINWSWTNPTDADFNHTIVYINDVWEANVSTPYYNDTGLSPGTTYNISTHTVDIYGNINQTWVNASATTLPYPPPNITSYEPTSDPSNTEGASRTFSMTSDQIVNVSWKINGTLAQTNTSVLNASYTNDSAVVGCWNVSAIITNPNGSDIQTWLWTVSAYTPPVYRGGGGGYTPTPTSTPAPTPVVVVEITKQIQSIEGGKSEVVTFEEPESDVTGIKINVKNNVSGVEIKIQKLSGAPPEVMKKTPSPMITGATVETYSYLNISTTNITDEDITNASINFTVNKSWILEEEIDEDSVTLHRYNNTTANWTALSTNKTGEDNKSVYYMAHTPGFSIFVITGEKRIEVKPTATPVPTLTPILAPTPTPAVAITPTTPPVTPKPTVPEPTAGPWMPDTYTSIMILVAVAALVASSYVYHIRERATPQQFRKIATELSKRAKGGDGKVKKGGRK